MDGYHNSEFLASYIAQAQWLRTTDMPGLAVPLPSQHGAEGGPWRCNTAPPCLPPCLFTSLSLSVRSFLFLVYLSVLLLILLFILRSVFSFSPFPFSAFGFTPARRLTAAVGWEIQLALDCIKPTGCKMY